MEINIRQRINGQKLTMIFQKLTMLLSLFVTLSLYSNDKITLGLTGVTLKEDIVTLMNLKNYLSTQANIDVNLKFAKSYSIMESFIINESVDIAYVCGSTYVNLSKLNKVDLLAIPTNNHQTSYSSLIIAKENSSFQGLFDLKNKTFAMSDPDSNSGSLVPLYEIMKKGYSKDSFFQKVVYTYDHGESIQAVLSGFVDAASIDSMIYQAYITKNPEVKTHLKVIDQFDDYPIPPFIIRKNMNNSVKIRLQNALLNMHNDRFGKEILHAMAIDNFIKPNTISYDKIDTIKQFIINYKSNDVK
ncbi:MAG: phosphate/phosphite/phosphonate ABC transporter substrate-binding protein [Arcobacteraceae bacterium]